MPSLAEIEDKAMSLPDGDRAKLADRLLASLPSDFTDDAEVDEALRRSEEMDKDPSRVLSHEEFFLFFEERRK